MNDPTSTEQRLSPEAADAAARTLVRIATALERTIDVQCAVIEAD